MSPAGYAVVALSLFDAAATYLHLSSGRAVEGNPVVLALIGQVGLPAAMFLRAAVGLAGAVALEAFADAGYGIARVGLRLTAVALAAVAVWHVVGGL